MHRTSKRCLYSSILLAAVLLAAPRALAEPVPAAHWTFDNAKLVATGGVPRDGPGVNGVVADPQPGQTYRPAAVFVWFVACAIWLAPSGSVRASAEDDATAGQPPNIVFIFCDNLGYGDVGCFNPDAKQPTPRIDRMAAEGRKFTHCYAAAPVCTPSRAALMTGCYPRRVGLDVTPDGWVLRPASPNGLNPSEITIAESLKQQGYATACIGKWHLGDQPPFLPTLQGFDYYLGIPYSDDMTARDSRPSWPPLPLMENEKVIEAPVDRNLLTKRYTQRAIRFIEAHQEGPFFLYLPQAMPGSTAAPFASEAFRGKSDNGPWGDSVMELDWSVGEILDAVERFGLAENTLVIWTNDNGAPAPDRRGGSNLPESRKQGSGVFPEDFFL